MQRVRSALLALFVVFFVSASPAAAITNGQPDGNWHSYVGMVFNDDVLCSGTLISPRVVLTAGHCTAGQTDLYVSFNEAVYSFEGIHGTPYTHPQYCLGCAPGLPGYAAYDVGVVVLSSPVEGVGFGALPYQGQINDLWNGATLTAVGYGVQDFVQGQPTGLQERLFATVSFINNNHKMADMFLKHSTSPGQGQGGVCWGDSGGPIFADDQYTVLAVTSFGGGNCNANAYAQRVDLVEVTSWVGSFPREEEAPAARVAPVKQL